MYSGKKIGVVVPAYNEEKLICKTINTMPDFVDKIIVIDDCSTDDTAGKARECSSGNDKVQVISHPKNLGVGGAISSGFKRALDAGMDIICIMAGDNQMDPDYLAPLLDPIIKGKADFTKGNRLKRSYWKGMSPFRLFGNTTLSLLTKFVTGYWHINDPQNGYVAITKEALEQMDLDAFFQGYAFENDIMVKANVLGIKMKNVLIPARYGEEQSKIKYVNFILKTSWHLFKSYFWRIWKKYFRRPRLIGLLYLLPILGIITWLVGSLLTGFNNWIFLGLVIGSPVVFIIATIADAINGL